MSLPQQDFTNISSSKDFSIGDFNTEFQNIYTYINSYRGEIDSKVKNLNDDGSSFTGNVTGNLTGTASYATYLGDSSGNYTYTTLTNALNGKSDSNHGHNYAGSSSDGGAANSVKANLTLSNSSNGSASGTTYNGSTAVTIGYKSILNTNQQNAVNSGITSTKVSQYDMYNTTINNKVDKVTGKGLSTNDFTDEYKAWLDNQISFDATVTIGSYFANSNWYISAGYNESKLAANLSRVKVAFENYTCFTHWQSNPGDFVGRTSLDTAFESNIKYPYMIGYTTTAETSLYVNGSSTTWRKVFRSMS